MAVYVRRLAKEVEILTRELEAPGGAVSHLKGFKKSLPGRNDDQDRQESFSVGDTLGLTGIEKPAYDVAVSVELTTKPSAS